MRFERLDLNLLVALDVLLTERSVSLAAERLFLSQSAASSALARLRDYFGDELLITKGRQMTLTVRAENLIEPVRAVLDQIRSTITVAQPFDPASADRQVRIMASDYTTQVLLADALAGFAGIAPGLRFELQPMGRKPVEAMDRGFADLLITIDFAVSPDHPSRFLFEDDYVVVGCRSNRALSRPLTPDAYFDLGHVTARLGRGHMPAFDEWFTRRQRQTRRVEVVAPNFLSLPLLVLNTDRVATMHRRQAERMERIFPLRIAELPFVIPSIRQVVQWHCANNGDKALTWIIEQLVRFAQGEQHGQAHAPTPQDDAAISHDAMLRRFTMDYRAR